MSFGSVKGNQNNGESKNQTMLLKNFKLYKANSSNQEGWEGKEKGSKVKEMVFAFETKIQPTYSVPTATDGLVTGLPVDGVGLDEGVVPIGACKQCTDGTLVGLRVGDLGPKVGDGSVVLEEARSDLEGSRIHVFQLDPSSLALKGGPAPSMVAK